MLYRKCPSLLMYYGGPTLSQCSQFRFLQTPVERSRGRSNVKIPRKKTWSNIAVLQSLNESIKMNPEKNQYYPLSSADFAPNTHLEDVKMLKSMDNAKNVVQFVKTELPDYTDLQWPGSEVSGLDRKSAVPGIPETTRITEDPTFEKLEKYLNEKDWKEFGIEFKSLMENGDKIPQELTEKIVGIISFTGKQSGKFDSDDLLKSYSLVIDSFCSSNKYSKYMACVVLRKQSFTGRLWEVRDFSNFLLKNNHLVDGKTADMLLSCCSYHGTRDPIADDLIHKNFGNEPSTTSILHTSEAFYEKMPKKERLELWGQCIREMEICNVKPDMSVYAKMLNYALRFLKDSDIVYALISIIRDAEVGDFDFVPCMHNAMNFAIDNKHLDLAAQVYETVNKLQQRSGSSYTIHSAFYVRYVSLLAQIGTLENFFVVASHLFKQRKFLPWKLMDGIVQSCVERNWPEVLPFLFSMSYTSTTSLDYYSEWFAAAIYLIDGADSDTITQFKNIAILVSKNNRILSVNHLNTICLLVAKSRDEIALKSLLFDIKRNHRTNILDASTIEECKNTIGENSRTLNKLLEK